MTVEALQPPITTSLGIYAGWTLIFFWAHLRDFVRNLLSGRKTSREYARIRQDYEDVYTRRAYFRCHDSWNRPIASSPDTWIDILERTDVDGQKPLRLTGKKLHCLNLGSYNYLGFAAADEYCTPRVLDTLQQYGWATCSSRTEAGTTPFHVELERRVAAFVGKEAAVTFGMGFATNSMVIPALVGRGCLVISDALNHASIVAGVRGSGAKVKVFGHNDMVNLEAILRTSIAEGQPRTHRPWKKILIIVEGIYSMEGDICPLAEIVEIKKRYKAYLWLDEAHSIGALGATGRGCAEWSGVDTADIDVMMGTFTKSFGASGGYIAGSKALVQKLRQSSPSSLYASSMAVPVAMQVISAFQVITGEDGSDRGAKKLHTLTDNANYVRQRLTDLGCIVSGDYDSPILPLMVYQPGKLSAFSRQSLARGLAVVSVGFPATSLTGTRIRFCISAAHTREDLDWAMEVMEELVDMCLLRYRSPPKEGSAAPKEIEA